MAGVLQDSIQAYSSGAAVKFGQHHPTIQEEAKKLQRISLYKEWPLISKSYKKSLC
jgi:hypothetical protein